MLVTTKRQVFDSLDDAALAWACIEPTHLQILRGGKNPSVKLQVTAQLTSGQQALLMFYVLYGHIGNSIEDFYGWVSYLLTESRSWSGIKGGLRFFRDDAMLRLLEKTESLLEARRQQRDAERHNALPWNLDNDPELFASVDQLNATFHEIVPATLKLIGEYIRNHQDEFVQFED